MGEVYRARDTKLNRDVAIKVLPDAFASDAERLARFSREAQMLASLNHPNIAQIYGFEESDGVRALVMELVEGEDAVAADRAWPDPDRRSAPDRTTDRRGARSGARAGHHSSRSEARKHQGPADGTVKVLDFGLAKLMETTGSGLPDQRLTQSPTITTPAMTAAGVILGTAAYMAPEQARGTPVDKRADIWAFGCVVFEMLAGRRAFEGESISDVIASVLKTEPHWESLSSETPSALSRLIRRCLRKDPRRRLQAIGEARVQIEDLLGGSSHDERVVVTAASAPWWRRALPWGIAGLSLLVAVVMIVRSTLWRSGPPAPPLRLVLQLERMRRWPLAPETNTACHLTGRSSPSSRKELKNRPRSSICGDWRSSGRRRCREPTARRVRSFRRTVNGSVFLPAAN